jgi:hypothetical protein
MGQRVHLQELLEDILGSRNAYFQPPANVQLLYPCIVYERMTADSMFAGNKMYRYTKKYQVTVIDRDPDTAISDKVATLPMCSYRQFFKADNLNHDVFDLYF